jgi:hypothetical protein
VRWSVIFSKSRDESLLVFYESVRRQVDADIKSGGHSRFIGEPVKQYADRLGEEMDRRRLRFYANRLATLTATLPSSLCDTTIDDSNDRQPITSRVCGV